MIVTVTRTGGFAGLTRTGELDTATAPDGERVEQTLQGLDPARIPDNIPQPDRYRFHIRAGDVDLNVAEQDLDPDLAWLVNRVLE